MLTSIATASYTMAAVAYLFFGSALVNELAGPLARDSAAHRLPVFCALGGDACLSGYPDLPAFAPDGYPGNPQKRGLVRVSDNTAGALPAAGFSSTRKVRPAVAAIVALYIVCFCRGPILSWELWFFAPHKSIDFINSIVGSVAMAIIGMILVEQLYRNTPVKQRWGIKFACLGIGGDFCLRFLFI